MDQLAAKIGLEVTNHGAISFARFMELALYCPVYGYYETEADNIGRRGDYYTSVSVGKLFGQLLACQFGQWLDAEQSGTHRPLQLVEAGAHRGDLARDILEWFRGNRPDLFASMQYWVVEPSQVRRSLQEKTLSEYMKIVHWHTSFAELPAPGPFLRVIFSNELLDAFPVHRFGWDAQGGRWFEWGVAFGETGFKWVRMPYETSEEPGSPSEAALGLLRKQFDWLRASAGEAHGRDSERLLEVLPDGFTLEISPAAEQWWREAAAALVGGKLLTIDYGHTFDELLTPERSQGTVRAYRRHQMEQDVLAVPGQQDITADVNFTLLEQAGVAARLRTEFFDTQTRFLTSIAGRVWERKCSFGEWTADFTRQFQTLTHPDHLGSRFKVLVQAKNPTPAEIAVRS